MELSGVEALAKAEVSTEIAVKVVKDQLKGQEQMVAALMQPTLVYDSEGRVHAAPPHSSFDVRM
ncbi:MAG TPA: hypothetical protein VK470_07870 [Bacteroidota bacterium]|nr:hypothetical protein [Bacteroidota bacterium]